MGEPRVVLQWGDAEHISISSAGVMAPKIVVCVCSEQSSRFLRLRLTRGEARVLIDALEREVSASYEPAFVDGMVRDE